MFELPLATTLDSEMDPPNYVFKIEIAATENDTGLK